MLSEDLQIYRDTFELCKLMHTYSGNVPKSVRYGEYGRAMSMSLDALDMIYVANSDKDRRPAALTRYLQFIGGVRSRIRLIKELRLISVRQSVNLLYLIDKVQRQAIGWRNSHGQSRGATCNTGEPHFQQK